MKYNIDSENIVLIGSSYGGKLVLKASDYIEKLGGIVLISGVVDTNIKNLEKLKKTKIIGFYGKLDPLANKAHIFFKENRLINSESNNLKIYKGEGHFFHRSTTWASIYGSIIEEFSNTKKVAIKDN